MRCAREREKEQEEAAALLSLGLVSACCSFGLLCAHWRPCSLDRLHYCPWRRFSFQREETDILFFTTSILIFKKKKKKQLPHPALQRRRRLHPQDVLLRARPCARPRPALQALRAPGRARVGAARGGEEDLGRGGQGERRQLLGGKVVVRLSPEAHELRAPRRCCWSRGSGFAFPAVGLDDDTFGAVFLVGRGRGSSGAALAALVVGAGLAAGDV